MFTVHGTRCTCEMWLVLGKAARPSGNIEGTYSDEFRLEMVGYTRGTRQEEGQTWGVYRANCLID
jgi:hypothetical protein